MHDKFSMISGLPLRWLSFRCQSRETRLRRPRRQPSKRLGRPRSAGHLDLRFRHAATTAARNMPTRILQSRRREPNWIKRGRKCSPAPDASRDRGEARDGRRRLQILNS